MKEDARAIFAAAIRAADPVAAMRAHWSIDPDKYRKIYVLGAGKAAAVMAAEAERILGSRITAGAVNTKQGHGPLHLTRIEVTEAAHPIPDQAGVHGAERIAALASMAAEGDLVLFLLSGGASALLPLPVEGLSLEEKQDITQSLLDRGATIHQMNTVRKHLSRTKGGQLAAMAQPAEVIALILSDVVGDNLEVIGSGPTAADPTTVPDAEAVLRHFAIEIPGVLRETPKQSAATNLIIGSNRQALEAASQQAQKLGYLPRIVSSTVEGEAREVARTIAAMPAEPGTCLIFGGETTVTLQGTGKGGRNQELALAAAIAIRGERNVVILSGGTDGTDGPTDAAGGIVDGDTADRNAQAALDNNDSYHYLKNRGALLITGPTGTNVMDIQLRLN